MIISNYQQFYNLIKSDSLPIKTPLEGCITSVNKICSCRKQAKARKSEECNNLYVEYIKNYSEANVELWRSKTNDNEIVFNHNSHYLIKKIKLR